MVASQSAPAAGVQSTAVAHTGSEKCGEGEQGKWGEGRGGSEWCSTNCGCTERRAPRARALLFSSWPRCGVWRVCLFQAHTPQPQKKKVQRTTGQTISKKDATVTFHCQKAQKKDSLRRKFRKRASLLRSIPLRRAAARRRRHPAAPGRSRQHRRTPGFPAAAGPAQRACCASCQRRPFSVFAIAGNSQNLSSAKKKRKGKERHEPALTRD